MKKGIKRLLAISLIVLAIVAITISVKAATSTTNNIVEKVESDSNEDKYQIVDGTIVIGKSKFTPEVTITGENSAIAGANDLAIYVSENKTNSGYQYPKMYTCTLGEWYQYVDGKATKQVSMDSVEIWYINNVLKDGLTEPILEEPAKPVTKYNVLFVSSEENKILDEIQVEEGKTVETVPDAKRDGYELIGWTKATTISTDTTEVELDKVSSEKITSDTIFFAKWSEVTKFKVSLDEVGKNKGSNTLLDALKKLGYNGNYDKDNDDKLTLSENGKLSGLIEITEGIPDTTFSGDKKTGYYFAYVLDVEGTVTQATTVTLKGNGEEKTLPFSAFDDVDNGKMAILVSLNKNASDKTTSVVVDLDGSGDKYTAKTYTIDWSGVTFQEASKATISTENLPQEDVEFISTDWGYAKTTQDTYKLEPDKSDPLKLKLTGTVVKQEIAENVFPTDEEKGYYFMVNISDASFKQGTTITYPVKKGTQTETKTLTGPTDSLTLLFALDNTKQDNKNFKITVDLDGDGDEYTPVTYTIDYSDVTYSEPSKVIIAVGEENIDKTTIAKALNDTFRWSKPENWNVEFKPETDETDETKLKVEVTGILPIMTEVSGFSADETTNYYLPVVIKSTVKPTEETKLVIPSLTSEGGNKVVIGDSSWDKTEEGDSEIVILMSLKPQEVQTMALDAQSRTFDIVVDMDGDGDKYVPYTVTIDYTDLKFQQESKGNSIALGDEKQPNDEFTSWGYKPETNQNLTLENGLLKGKLIEQELSSTDAFGENNKDGYYFDFKIELPDNIDTEKVTITRLQGPNGEAKKTFDKDDLDDNGDLPILFRFDKDKTGCSKCSGNPTTCKCCSTEGTEACECEDYKLYYRVDFDGDGNEYLPQDYVIDYCGVTFEKSSIFTVEGLEPNHAEQFEDDGWFTKEGYYTKFEEVTPNRYKVTGVLPIFGDTEWKEKHDPLESAENDYYLGLLLKLVSAPNNMGDGSINEDTINVKFFHDDEDEETKFGVKATGNDFYDSKELYILKYLVPSDEPKEFDIIVDLDGDNKDEYAPFTVTIDYSELKFQNNSLANGVGFDVLSKDEITDGSPEKTELEKYKFNFDTIKEVTVKQNEEQPDKAPYNEGIEGTIKQQTLKAGTFKNDTGYFVPIKIEFPKDEYPEYADNWILILNTEDNETKIYKPTKKEYEQGWVLVLFRLNENVSEEEKVIKYSIDFDGEYNKEAHTGADFVPFEYEIKYDSLTFETENKITYKYKDNKGNDQTEEKVAYENEIVNLKDLTSMNTAYRTFDGWYKEYENVSEIKGGFKTEKDEDVTLTAHWKLNVEKFMEDVIADLKNPDSTYSKDFSGQFELEQKADNKNEITIKVESPNVKLSKLAETSIPGTIAYILQKGEIKDVTLNVGSEEATFNKEGVAGVSEVGAQANEDSALDETGKALKQKVITDAKEAFNTELAKKQGSEATATMDQVEFEGTTFTLKIGAPTDKTITLVDAKGEDLADGKDTYTFKFNSDFAVVDENDNLGPDTIKEALDKNNYDTIYIDGNLTETATIEISTEKDVTIEPVENASKDKGLMTAAEAPKHTITVSNQNYAIDVQSTGKGTVTIKDLKITGGKKAELKIEDDTNVTVDNIDVSGNITQATSREDEMNASIIVKGNLTASNVKNSNESYALPTIAVITDYAHPDSKDPEHAEDTKPTTHLSTNATVKVDNMTKNGTYCLVDRTNQKFHYSKETYYGSFYYNDKNNSQIYFMGVIDQEQKEYPYDAIQIYYYNDKIDISKIGYQPNTSPVSDDKVFTHFYMDDNRNNKIENNDELAQNKLKAHNTTVAHAVYNTKPISALNFEKVSGLSTSGNKVSGTISTQNEKGKFVIPVTLTSEKFQEGVSTVEVTDPNGEEKTYTYSSVSESGIATVSNAKVMKLELEAIKSSKITGNNGKIYNITVDIDGKDKNEVKPETYSIDYSKVKTLEEKINKAAENTLEANSFTVTKDNKINGYTEEFTYKYNAKDGLTYLKAEKDNVEEYTFSAKYAGVDSSKLSVVVRKRKDGEEDSKVYLNDWVYVHPQQVGRAIHEVTMLTDVMKDSKTSINAIDTVELVKGKKHNYTVKLNGDKYTDWVNNNYRLTSKYTVTEWGETVLVDVELDENDQYIKSIKTHQKSSSNTFHVTFTNVNKTNIQVPTKFLAEKDKTLKDEDIKNFYEAGKQWWSKHTGSQPAE